MSSLIKLEGLKKYYKVGKNKICVLKSIDLEIKAGEFVMIMGKSGSGKTTLLNILSFLDNFDSGKYYFNDDDVTNLNENQRSSFRNKHIGFVFQQFNLINTLSVYKNVELPLIYSNSTKYIDKDILINEKLKSVGLLDKSNYYPIQLSGGQQQRIAIARSLVNNPQIIFADEPTGALDSDTGIEIMNLLKELNKQGKTIIMVTHDQDLVKYATRVIKLKDGVLSMEV